MLIGLTSNLLVTSVCLNKIEFFLCFYRLAYLTPRLKKLECVEKRLRGVQRAKRDSR